MIISCWSVKGGSGTTVVSAGLAIAAGRSSGRSTLLVDLAGDLPAVLGVAPPVGPGLAEWLAADPAAPPDAIGRLEVEVSPEVGLLHRGDGRLEPRHADVLLQVLGASGRTVVVDCGLLRGPGVALQVAAQASRSLLVIRPCYPAVRRAAAAPIRPSGIVVVREPGRALGNADLSHAVGAPIEAEVAVDPSVARAVDAGLLVSRMPRGFGDTMRAVA